MEQQTFQAGDVIFREGEDSQDAYRILSGKVQISITTPSGPRVLSHLFPGEIFGEMGMVDDQPRSATAIATKECLVEKISMESFIKYILSDSDRLSSYLGTVFERLRSSDLMLQMALKTEGDMEYIGKNDRSLEELFYGTPVEEAPAVASEAQSLTLRSTSNVADPIEMTIEEFPLRIGRLDILGESSPFTNNHLSVPDQRPFQISRNHCVIDGQAGRFFVRDRGSTLGTMVNGVRIGANHDSLTAELVPGENSIVLGGNDSTHTFSLVLS